MVSEKKIRQVKEIKELLKQYPVVGILDLYKLPARQLFEIREKLRGKALIRMYRKRIIQRALFEAGLEKLAEYLQGEPALLFTQENPFELARLIEQNKSYSKAKAGDILPEDLWIRAGPTPLPPGPAIGLLQKFGIQAGVEGEKVVVRADKLIAKAGEEVSPELADLLGKLDIKPIQLRLNLLAAWDSGLIYTQDLLFKSRDQWLHEIQESASSALSLAFSLKWPAAPLMPLYLSEAYQHARALALEAGIEVKELLPDLLALAAAKAASLEKFLNMKAQ